MVESYQTEEEQLEAIKRWFRDNGQSLLAAVLVALLAVFGFRYWQDLRLRHRDAAAAEYQNLQSAVQSWDADAKADALTTANTLADKLKTDFPSSAYAHFAALEKARLAVQKDDLGAAETELRWVLAHDPAADIKAIAEVRLARVLFARGDSKGALAIIDAAKPGAYAFLFARLRGDILLARGDTAGARTAYEKARKLESESGKPVNDPVLRMRLNDLNTDTHTATGAAADAGNTAAKAPAASPTVAH